MSDSNRPIRQAAIRRAEGHSPFLRQAAAAWPALVELFEARGSEAAVAAALAVAGEDVAVALRRARRQVALAVALGDLAGELPLERVTAILSGFADRAIDRAIDAALAERLAGRGAADQLVPGQPRGIAAIALGKLGSGELNYSSDVDLLLLFDPRTMPRRERDDAAEAAVRYGRRLIEILQQRTAEGYVARVDLRLRPSPEVTPIVLPIDAAISYYESSALAWERAAFIRARAAAGDRALGERFLAAIQPFVWRRALDYGAIDEIGDIAQRVRDHYAQGQALGPGFDLKRGRGGIREVEFHAQILQMIHGGREPALRAPATLDALAALASAGHIELAMADELAFAYRLLRTIEHRVQMVDDQQTHRLPEGVALDGVARLHGLADGGALIDELRPAVASVGSAFDRIAAPRTQRLARDPDLLLGELAALGLADPQTAARRIGEWRSGRVRSLRSPAALAAFEAMLPALLARIAAGPDQAHALNRFTDLVERLSSGVNLFRLIEARPALGELLALILVHAPVLAEQLARRPALLDGLIDASSFDPPPAVEPLAERLAAGPDGENYDGALDRIRHLVNERRFALGVQLIAARHDPLEVAAGYSRVAEAAIIALARAATAEFEQSHGRIAGGELAIVGLGRLGGGALTQASDLDLIFLFSGDLDEQSDGPRPLGTTEYFNRLARRIVAALSVATAAGPLYEVDTRLRPQGMSGLLAVSLGSFERYQREEAWTWEHLALTRARPVHGSPAMRSAIEALLASILTTPRDLAELRQEAGAMRDEIARHKPPSGPLDIKLGPGGLVDLEFAIQTLQLGHGAGLDPRLDRSLDQLIAGGYAPAELAEAHALLTRMLVTMRLVAPGGQTPEEPSRPLVAAACGFGEWDALLAAHDAARHSVGQFWNKIRSSEQ